MTQSVCQTVRRSRRAKHATLRATSLSSQEKGGPGVGEPEELRLRRIYALVGGGGGGAIPAPARWESFVLVGAKWLRGNRER